MSLPNYGVEHPSAADGPESEITVPDTPHGVNGPDADAQRAARVASTRWTQGRWWHSLVTMATGAVIGWFSATPFSGLLWLMSVVFLMGFVVVHRPRGGDMRPPTTVRPSSWLGWAVLSATVFTILFVSTLLRNALPHGSVEAFGLQFLGAVIVLSVSSAICARLEEQRARKIQKDNVIPLAPSGPEEAIAVACTPCSVSDPTDPHHAARKGSTTPWWLSVLTVTATAIMIASVYGGPVGFGTALASLAFGAVLLVARKHRGTHGKACAPMNGGPPQRVTRSPWTSMVVLMVMIAVVFGAATVLSHALTPGTALSYGVQFLSAVTVLGVGHTLLAYLAGRRRSGQPS